MTQEQLDKYEESDEISEARSNLDEAITAVEFIAEGMPTLEVL